MRPNRFTRPAAWWMPAALSAATLSACEPPEAGTAPESAAEPFTVLRGPDGGFQSLPGVPGGPGGGNPLADDGDDTYTCHDAEDCHEKCPDPQEDGGSTGCICLDGGVRWVCVVTYYGPGEHPWEEENGGCGGGGGGGIDDDTLLLACQSPPVVINCGTGGRVERGYFVSCTADTGLDTVPGIRYVWEATSRSGGNRVTNRYVGVGPDFQTWEGTATGSVYLTVEVWAPGDTRMAGGIDQYGMTVWPRDWRLQEQGATPQYVAPIPGGDEATTWGLYRVGDDLNLRVGEGTGPWAGHYFVAGWPWIGGAEMYVHADVKPLGPVHGALADTTCGIPAGFKTDVYSLNLACRNHQAVDAFDLLLRRHEHMHQWSLNQCIRSANSGRLAEIEKLVSTDYGTVDDGLKEYWKGPNGLATDLQEAVETPQSGQRSGNIWEWRGQSAWAWRSVRADDHDGQWGC